MFTRELASGAVVPVLADWALFAAGRLASAKARAFADHVAAILHGP